MGAKLQVGLNLLPGTGLNSWFFLLKDSQSVTHLRQTVYAPGRKVPVKRHHPFYGVGKGVSRKWNLLQLSHWIPSEPR